MADDIDHRMKSAIKEDVYFLPPEDLYNYVLMAIDKLLMKHGCSLRSKKLSVSASLSINYLERNFHMIIINLRQNT